MSVLENLSDNECYLIALLMDPSGVDIAEFCWQDPNERDNLFRCYDYQVPWYRNDSKKQIDQCVAEGTLVLTARGYVPIEDVVVGDQVWTHEERWREVRFIWDRGEQDVVLVKGAGHHGIRVTADHKFWREDGSFAPLEVGTRWGSPMRILTPEPVLVPAMTPAYRSGRQNYVRDTTQPDFLWLYGLYLAEGSISSSFGTGGQLNRVTFSVHTDEARHVQDRLDSVGLRYNVQPVSTEQCVNIVVNSQPLAEWMLAEGGRRSTGKRIAMWVHDLEEKDRAAIFDGYMYGDGWTGVGKQGETRLSFTTASKALAYGMKHLAISLGWYGSTHLRQRAAVTIDGRDVTGRETYVTDLRRGRSRAGWPQRNNHVWGLVRSIEPVGRARVYDLEVDGDHSFVVEGLVVSNCARAIGKSVGIQMRGFAFPFTNPGQEMLITAPEMIHLDPVTKNIEDRLLSTRLSREMLKSGNQSSGITHRPFEAKFRNNAKIIGRIPQKDGKGVKGQHPRILEMDEAQDYPEPGWIELIETLRYGDETSRWRAHGVSRGVRDYYYKLSQAEDWYVHRITAMHRPDWTADERKSKAELYGSREHADYRRNILGLHGDAMSSLFVLHRLMACVDAKEDSHYNSYVYTHIRINDEWLRASGATIEQLIDLPGSHKEFKRVWVGMDVGMTNHPTEILVFGAEPKPSGRSGSYDGERLRCLTRIHLERISGQDQLRVMDKVAEFYKPLAFGMDRTGLGLPIFQVAQDPLMSGHNLARSIRGYNFSEKIPVAFEPMDDDNEWVPPEDRAILGQVLEYSSDTLRLLVDQGRVVLPWDTDMLKEFQGQAYYIKASATNPYGKKEFNKGKFHALDAARMAALAWSQESIEKQMALSPEYAPVMLTWADSPMGGGLGGSDPMFDLW